MQAVPRIHARSRGGVPFGSAALVHISRPCSLDVRSSYVRIPYRARPCLRRCTVHAAPGRGDHFALFPCVFVPRGSLPGLVDARASSLQLPGPFKLVVHASLKLLNNSGHDASLWLRLLCGARLAVGMTTGARGAAGPLHGCRFVLPLRMAMQLHCCSTTAGTRGPWLQGCYDAKRIIEVLDSATHTPPCHGVGNQRNSMQPCSGAGYCIIYGSQNLESSAGELDTMHGSGRS